MLCQKIYSTSSIQCFWKPITWGSLMVTRCSNFRLGIEDGDTQTHSSSWSEQSEIFSQSGFNSKQKSVKRQRIIDIISNSLSVSSEKVALAFDKHPKKTYILEKDVALTLQYLKEKGFDSMTIGESIAICFYPKENIEHGLSQISANEAELYNYGFINGYVSQQKETFKNGTVLKDKRLQLCLYYIELPFCFSGSGIFNFIAS